MKGLDVKKYSINYIWVLCFLLLTAFTLIANNYLIYNSLYSIDDVSDSPSTAGTVFDKISSISIENDFLRNENELLKQQLSILQNDNIQQREQFLEIQHENFQIKEQLRELIQDNISLQNTLKTAASVGIKPQNYREFEGIPASRTTIERGTYIGKFKGTVYTPSSEECGNDKGITFSGEPIVPGISVAVDLNYWPLGTVFYIRGLGYVVAMDKGSAIKGKDRFDFAVFDKKFANAIGSQLWDVYLIKMGSGKVENIDF